MRANIPHPQKKAGERGMGQRDLAEVAVPRQMFGDILLLIARLRAPPAPA